MEHKGRDADRPLDEEREAFLSLCRLQGVQLSDRQIDTLDRYVAGLCDWNKKINLISRKDASHVWTKHIAHCISLLSAVRIPDGSRIVDIGTGGGLPGIPIKILRPDLSFLLIDATRKKTDAVSDIVGSLGLGRLEVAWGRAETVASQSKFNRKFDFSIARAVSSLVELIEWAKPFLAESPDAVKGETQNVPVQVRPPALIAFKGGDISGELREVGRRHKSVAVHVVDLSQSTKLVPDCSEKKLVIVNF